jgi:hypothetical protein
MRKGAQPQESHIPVANVRKRHKFKQNVHCVYNIMRKHILNRYLVVTVLLMLGRNILGAEPVNTADLSWEKTDLVLRLQTQNPLREALVALRPCFLFKRPGGRFGSLRIRVWSPDGKDQTDRVFGTNYPVRAGVYISWPMIDVPSSRSTEISLRLVSDLRVNVKDLPIPGWKIGVQLVGYTAAQEKKLTTTLPIETAQLRQTPISMSGIQSIWSTRGDLNGEYSNPKDETVIIESTVLVPSK